MKFAFICIVIVISCSVCACNDLDLFSGLNYNYQKRKNVPRLPEYDRLNFYPKFGYSLDDLQDDYDDDPKLTEYESVSDRIRQLRADIDWQRSRLHKHRPHRENPELRYHQDQLKPERFELKIPTIPRLEEQGVYSSEDDLGEDFKEILRDPIFENDFAIPERLISDRNDEEEPSHGHNHHQVHRNDEDSPEFKSNRFKDVKVISDPSEFAYGPSDPKFHRKWEEATEKTTETTPERVITTEPKVVPIPRDKVIVSSRSDQISSENSRLLQAEVNRKDGGIEMVPVQQNLTDVDSAGVYIIAIVAGISAAATVGLIAVGIGWYNLQKHVKNASDVEYPAYGVTGPNKDISPSGDRRLAQSAQMYHYQHQKQQIIAMERAPPGERHGSISDAESDEENEEGDYTVYECPGLAPTGEMEVKNPLFQDDPTPSQTPAARVNGEEKQ